MRAVLVLWDLSSGSKVSFEELRQYLRDESIAMFGQLAGLRQKTWISNPETGRWGALYLFDEREQADALVGRIDRGRVVALTGAGAGRPGIRPRGGCRRKARGPGPA